MWAAAEGHHELRKQPEWSTDDVPVVNVTWDEARAFCSFIGGRLPTEAEWEYAARAGSTGARYGTLDDIAWYVDNSGNSRPDVSGLVGDGFFQALRANGNRAHSIGSKVPNAFGLYDMLGNVWQWTADWWGEKYYRNKIEVDPKGPASGDSRVVRGGSWYFDARKVRASFRAGFNPSNRDDGLGFRCARDAHSPVTVPFSPGSPGRTATVAPAPRISSAGSRAASASAPAALVADDFAVIKRPLEEARLQRTRWRSPLSRQPLGRW